MLTCFVRGEFGNQSTQSSIRNISWQLFASCCWWRYKILTWYSGLNECNKWQVIFKDLSMITPYVANSYYILNSYNHDSNVCIFSDSETCSFTQPGLEQKWWQVWFGTQVLIDQSEKSISNNDQSKHINA